MREMVLLILFGACLKWQKVGVGGYLFCIFDEATRPKLWVACDTDALKYVSWLHEPVYSCSEP